MLGDMVLTSPLGTKWIKYTRPLVIQPDVEVSGTECEIKRKCNNSPANEPSGVMSAAGIYPSDLVRSKTWKSKFVAITKGKFKLFVDRLSVSSETKLEENWITGSGQAPHMGGSDEAVLAINVKSGEVFAAMLENGKTLSGFGFTSWENAPRFIKEWAADYKQ